MKGTGAAEQNFSGKADYADLLREGNVQRDRPGDVRPVEVPKKDGSGRRVTEFAGNAYGAAATPDHMANEIESLIQDGKMGFDTRSNQKSLQRAAEALENNTEGVKAQITENLAKNMVQDGDIEKAMLLYVKNANSKAKADQEAAAQLLVQLGQMANISGRNLQLFSMLRRMTPEGKLMYAKKAIDQELSRLRKAGAENASIPLPQRTISYTDTDGEKHADVRLSQEQFQKLAEKQGQTEQAVLSALLDSDDFRAMSDEVKDDVLALVHSYAKETGELAAIKNHLGYSATWMEELAEAEDPAKYIVQRVSGTNLNRAMTDLDTAWDHSWNTTAKERALDEAYEEYKSMSKEAQKEIEAFTTGTAKKYLEARGKGISHEDFLAAAKNVETVQGTGKYNSETKENKVRDIDKREAIAKTTGLSYPQIDIIMKAYMPDYDPTDEKPNKTELKYDYARKELGYSPAEYADIYRAYLEHDKKADKIKEIMKLGYDYGAANQMYKLFQGRVDVVAWAGK